MPHFLQAWNDNEDNPKVDSPEELWQYLNETYRNHKDPKTNKLSHYIWRRYADAFWDDIRIDNVLPFKESRDEEDEKHVHPLQLDVINRILVLWSNPGEIVLTPFMGVGSEVYCSVNQGRKSVGMELKPSYYRQTIKNLEMIGNNVEQGCLLSLCN